MTITLCLTKESQHMISDHAFESQGLQQQSISIYGPGPVSLTLMADADAAPAFFKALHEATGHIIDRLTLAALKNQAPCDANAVRTVDFAKYIYEQTVKGL